MFEAGCVRRTPGGEYKSAGLSSGWSIAGNPDRVPDYQIWCGPAMGAFNQWAAGSYLAPVPNRRARR